MVKQAKKRSNLVVASMMIMIISLLSSLLSFIKETLVAENFGLSVDADAYSLASQIPMLLFSVISVSITTIVIPIYSKKKFSTTDQEEVDRLASNIMNVVLVIAAVFAFIGVCAADLIAYLFAPGIDSETHVLTVTMIRIYMPTVIATGALNVFTGIMNVNKSFILPQLLSAFLTLVQIGFIAFGANRFGVTIVAYGLLVGAALQFLITLLFFSKKLHYSMTLDFKAPEIKSAGRQTVPIVVGQSIGEINRIIDKTISSFLSVGSIAALGYASKITTVISTLLVQSISTIVFPIFSENVAKKNKAAINTSYVNTLLIYELFLLPCIIGLFYFRDEIITIVYGRGAFNVENVKITAEVFGFYAASMFFTAIRTTCAKVYYSHGNTKSPVINAAIGAVCNIILNIILSRFLGIKGLAVATSVSAGIIAVLMMVTVRKKYSYISYSGFWQESGKILVGVIAMAVILVAIGPLIANFNMYVRIIIGVLVCAIAYFIILLLLKQKTVVTAKNHILGKFLKKK